MAIESQIIPGYVGNAITTNFTMTVAQSIAGWSVQWECWNDKETVTILKTVGNGITLLDTTNGVIQLVLSAADLTIPRGLYRWELTRTDTNTTLANGTMLLKQSP